MNEDALKEWLKENLKIVVKTDPYTYDHSVEIGLKFKDEEHCFETENIYIP